ncbi:MAG: helix-hairpin-helix domain-containing protein, partial [Melioribacteraceae bacterium]
MIFLLVFVIVFFSFTSASYPQIDTSGKTVDLEDLLEDASAEKEDLEFYDLLEYLSQNRIRLNSASINDLLHIPYLSRQSASAIIRHRNLTGGIRSAEQLSGAEGINPDLIERILPFIDFEEQREPSFFESFTGNLKDMDLQFRTRIINDLQKKEAYQTGKYEGSNLKFYNRLIIRKDKKLRIGILTEKDPGEKPINDFTTFHLYASDIGFIKNIAVGDYLFEFGQGLALWSRYSINKGIETIRLLTRSGKGIIPYLSTDENMFLRGGAVQFSIARANLYAFISNKKLDGSLDPLTNKITSIRLDGFHRNQNEADHRKIISEKIFGLSADYSFGEDASLGILYYNTEYGNSFESLTGIDPSGSRFSYLSAGYNILLKRLSISGESSYASGSIATINSAEFNIGKNFSLLFSFRKYPVKYWGLHTNGFGEKDGTQNETGFYSGLKLKTDYGILHFYYDQFKFPFTSEKFPFSSGGSEYLFYYTVKPMPNSELRIRYTIQDKDEQTVIDGQYG